MTKTWQRRAAGTVGFVALLGITLLMVLGPGARLGGALAESSVSASVAAATDHIAFVTLPESRPTFAFVETLTILGLGLFLLAGLIDHHASARWWSGPMAWCANGGGGPGSSAPLPSSPNPRPTPDRRSGVTRSRSAH